VGGVERQAWSPALGRSRVSLPTGTRPRPVSCRSRPRRGSGEAERRIPGRSPSPRHGSGLTSQPTLGRPISAPSTGSTVVPQNGQACGVSVSPTFSTAVMFVAGSDGKEVGPDGDPNSIRGNFEDWRRPWTTNSREALPRFQTIHPSHAASPPDRAMHLRPLMSYATQDRRCGR